MTPEQLKASILQYAIQGKLVEQKDCEGDAKYLYDNLISAKKRLVDQKIILKKAQTTPFFESEYPFDIPDSWKWVQLSDVSIIQEGAGIRKYQYRETGTQILCVTNILDGSIDLNKKKLYIDTDEYKEKYMHLTLNKGDIVTSCSGGSWGKISFFDSEETLMLNTSTLRMRFFDDLADNEYLYYVCQSSFFKNQLTKQLSGMQPNFGYAHYSRICFPLPPLEEQHRIVAKIEELLPFVDRYAKAYEKLEKFNAKFPEDMKKSILQYAIQGKLVEQRPEEGTAEELYQQIQEEKQRLIKEKIIKKEKSLAEITEDEIPFDIPESWKWCYLGDIFSHTAGKALNSKNTNGDKHKYITTSNVYWDHFELDNLKEMYYTKDEVEKYSVKYGDLLVLEGGDVGRTAIWNLQETYCIQNHIHKLRPFISVNVKYFYYVMMYLKSKGDITGKGIGIKGLSANALHCIKIPLPPLEEQYRIVAKIEELLPYCNQLIK